MSAISPARRAAARALFRLEADAGSFSGETVADLAAHMKLGDADKRLARALVFGVLRRALTLDWQYAPFLTKPPETLDPALRILLRMAAFQAWHMDKVPGFAIVNETVELARREFELHPAQVGFANALARKIVNGAPRDIATASVRVQDAIALSASNWLFGKLRHRFTAIDARAILEACLIEPELTVRVNSLAISRDEAAATLRADGIESGIGVLAPEALIIDGAHTHAVLQHPLFAEGKLYIQDEGSQMVGHIAKPVAGERVLDLCAAPGGKTTHLAELSGGAARITATDVSERRLDTVRENVARLATPGVEVVAFEEATGRDEVYDLVLIDAPCTGLGTIRRNPEIKYRVSEETVKGLSDVQLDIVQKAAPLLAHGGRIVYSTCSWTLEENRGVVERFLAENSGWRIEGDATMTWPSFPKLDGFEAYTLRREK